MNYQQKFYNLLYGQGGEKKTAFLSALKIALGVYLEENVSNLPYLYARNKISEEIETLITYITTITDTDTDQNNIIITVHGKGICGVYTNEKNPFEHQDMTKGFVIDLNGEICSTLIMGNKNDIALRDNKERIESVLSIYLFPEHLSGFDRVLVEFLNIVKIIEKRIISAPSPLVVQYKIDVAAATADQRLEVIYNGLVILERAIENNEILCWHTEQVSQQIEKGYSILHKQLAQLILSKGADSQKEIESTLDLKKCKELPLSKFISEILSQIEYLEKKNFFQTITGSDLGKTFNLVFQFYARAVHSVSGVCLTPELVTTVQYLLQEILNTAYAPCKKEIFSLIDQNLELTLEQTFPALEEWVGSHWKKPYDNTFLLKQLMNRLKNEIEGYRHWEAVLNKESPNNTHPLYQVHCAKYLQPNPNDPIVPRNTKDRRKNSRTNSDPKYCVQYDSEKKRQSPLSPLSPLSPGESLDAYYPEPIKVVSGQQQPPVTVTSAPNVLKNIVNTPSSQPKKRWSI